MMPSLRRTGVPYAVALMLLAFCAPPCRAESSVHRPSVLHIGSYKLRIPDEFGGRLLNSSNSGASRNAARLVVSLPNFEGRVKSGFWTEPPDVARLNMRNELFIFIKPPHNDDYLHRSLQARMESWGFEKSTSIVYGLVQAMKSSPRPPVIGSLGEWQVYYKPDTANPEVVVWCAEADRIIINPICRMEFLGDHLHWLVSFPAQHLPDWEELRSRSIGLVRSLVVDTSK